MRYLVVDDDEASCRGVARRLCRFLPADDEVACAFSAEEALGLCRLYGCQAAVLKERSPSCGAGAVYDGTFSGTLTEGDGVAAELLAAHGIPVFGESQAEKLLK